jgi:membrane associated rhomboid family serine protease
MFVQVDEHPKLKLRWATPCILALMVGVAVWEFLLTAPARAKFMQAWGVVPAELSLQWQEPGAGLVKLVSALFVHVDSAHLFGNLLFLMLFGFAVERVFRSRLVLLLFLLCGAIANIASAFLLTNKTGPIVGASGAVSGLIGAYLFLFPRASLGIVLPLGLYFQFVRVPASTLIGLWFLLQVLYTVTGTSISAVAWLAHVIGFIAGFVLAQVLKPLLYSNARSKILH